MESFACQHHARVDQLFVEAGHLGEHLLARHYAGFAVRICLDHDEKAHRLDSFQVHIEWRAPKSTESAKVTILRKSASSVSSPPARSWEDELMAERRAGRARPEDVDSDLEPLADELYGLRPEAFSAARDEAIRAARRQGKAALARELARLRKPTQSAWLVNLLWRDQREVMQQLFELANELSRAQA